MCCGCPIWVKAGQLHVCAMSALPPKAFTDSLSMSALCHKWTFEGSALTKKENPGTSTADFPPCPLDYLGIFARCRLRSRTPGPPPFSSMNSMPAASKDLHSVRRRFAKLRSNYHWAHCGFDSEIGMINRIVPAPMVWLWAHRYPVQDLQLNQGLRMLLAWEAGHG